MQNFAWFRRYHHFLSKKESAFLFSLFFLLWLIAVYQIPGLGMVCLCRQDLYGVGSYEVKKSSGGPRKWPNQLGKGVKNTQNGKKWQKKHILRLNFFFFAQNELNRNFLEFNGYKGPYSSCLVHQWGRIDHRGPIRRQHVLVTD